MGFSLSASPLAALYIYAVAPIWYLTLLAAKTTAHNDDGSKQAAEDAAKLRARKLFSGLVVADLWLEGAAARLSDGWRALVSSGSAVKMKNPVHPRVTIV